MRIYFKHAETIIMTKHFEVNYINIYKQKQNTTSFKEFHSNRESPNFTKNSGNKFNQNT